MLQQLIEKITEQQQGKENTAVYMVGEQLKDICRMNPDAAEIVLQDLELPEMSIEHAEKKIKEYADKEHKKHKGSCFCVPPHIAENIIKEFHGITGFSNSQTSANLQETSRKSDSFIDLSDFI